MSLFLLQRVTWMEVVEVQGFIHEVYQGEITEKVEVEWFLHRRRYMQTYNMYEQVCKPTITYHHSCNYSITHSQYTSLRSFIYPSGPNFLKIFLQKSSFFENFFLNIINFWKKKEVYAIFRTFLVLLLKKTSEKP